ncbi:penicillin-binding protein 1C [Collimonas arenae]|uniref:peptidoglycan glycosyltransferase n=1 Tax=Collimonas arenae TaxID=279058 RepID=A0A127QIB6_9BURK|nr:penicillin-binding protein 1C [Collimonas arenae]AMP09746.1 penicillin-binding protein 1C [Collimonas arenae]
MAHRHRRILLGVALAALLLIGLRLWPHASLRAAVSTSTAVYAKDGELLRLALAPDEQYRLWVPLSDIDPHLAQAVQLYEDRWFYWHPGVNPVALGRAVSSTYGGGTRLGASTITMQLARRLYGIQSQNVGGKLQQLGAALWLEARYSKREILEAYLNLAPYGGNIEGVAAASLIYFHKRAEHLTLPEILTLAVIPQNPSKRGGMSRLGGGLQQEKTRDQARKRLAEIWLDKHPEARRYKADLEARVPLYSTGSVPFLAPHVSDYLLRTKPAGEIWSSIDLPLQGTLERILGQFVANHRGVGVNNAAAMLIDRRSGEVRSVVGSANYFDPAIDGQVNGTQAKRSPGSTLKPFIYGLGLDQGLLHPMTILKDAPTTFGPFSPENFDGRFVGPIAAQDALVRSRNIPAVALASKLTQPSLYEFLQQAEVSRLASEKHYGLALALGGGELTMEELARLYLMLGSGGVLRPLHYDWQAPDVPQGHEEHKRLLSEEAAFITLQMLQTNPRPDTGEPGAPAIAWKTGTSWGFRDAWTAGVFGNYVLLVWVGNFDGSGNPAFVGVQTAAPLFFKIVDSMRAQRLDSGAVAQPVPANVKRVEVCRASGDLPNDLCTDRVQTWFIPGKSPIRISNLHRAVKIDSRTGLATCEDGPFTRTEVFEFWPTDMQRLFREAGMPRRQPPVQPDCGGQAMQQIKQQSMDDDGPSIISPNSGATYTMQLSKMTPIALRANATSAQDMLFWFANGGLIGKARAADSVGWLPGAPGRYQLRAIDQEGRADSREVEIEFVP